MHKLALATLVAAALAAHLPAAAQDDPVIVIDGRLAAAEALKDSEHLKEWAHDYSHQVHEQMSAMFASSLGPGRVVKGAPYAAEVITETHQALADGNTIDKRTAGAVYRDGEGRTRQETGSADAKARTVFINDPVAGTSYVLTPGAKRAVGIAPRALTMKGEGHQKQIVRLNGSEIRVEDGKVFVDGKEASTGRIEVVKGGKTIVVDNGKVTIDGKAIGEMGAGRQVVVKRIEGEDGTQREEVRVQVVRAGDGKELVVGSTPRVPDIPAIAALPPLPGVQTLRFESTAKLGKGVTTNLGMKDFDGVKAEGKSTSWTIAAGEIGNRNPITVTSETWYAPDLQVTVYSRHSDPRTGESIYRLGTIRRAEPAADLFKVPDDYTVRGRAPKG